MSERTQIEIRNGKNVVRVYSGWGIPRNILPALRRTATTGHTTPLAIAREFIRQVPDHSFGLHIIAKDYDPDALNYRYVVDVASNPWNVVQTRCAGHKIIDNGDGTGTVDPNLTSVRKRTLRIVAKA